MHGFNKGVGTYNFSVILVITVAGLEGNATRLMVFRHFDARPKCPSNTQVGQRTSTLVTMFAVGFRTQ